MTTALEACLPLELRGPGTTIAPVSAGLSGAETFELAQTLAAVHAGAISARTPEGQWQYGQAC